MIVIVLENHPYPKIIGRAPFITSLAHRCGLAANYHHNARVSLPNHLAMTSGSTHGLRRNCTPKQCHIRGPSIFTQLAHHHKTWRAYQEAMPGRCARASSGLYAARHDPAVYYRRIGNRQCRRHVVPLRYTHFSLMRTTARVLGIRRCLGKACSARGLSKAFRL